MHLASTLLNSSSTRLSLAARNETNKRKYRMPSRKKILLVEDDAPVREALTRALALENYQVLALANALCSRASARGESHIAYETLIDAAVFDLDRPDQHRWQTIRHVIATNPATRKIGTTKRRDRNSMAVVADLDALLHKPFDISVLLQALQPSTSN